MPDQGSRTGSCVTGESGTTVPLVLVSAYQHGQHRDAEKTLPKLPSHRFRYSVWHELSSTSVHGDQLKAPRVRDGPEGTERQYQNPDEDLRQIHHNRQGSDRKDYRNQMENWENAVFCNLSYQHLSHPYQRETFTRVLARLTGVVDLHLMEDGITDLARLSFPRCERFNLSKNYLKSFKQLPKLPAVSHLTLTDNDIEDLSGIDRLSRSPLQCLHLLGNPVVYSLNYRKRVFQKLPRLQILDNIPRMSCDDSFDEDLGGHEDRTCVIL